MPADGGRLTRVGPEEEPSEKPSEAPKAVFNVTSERTAEERPAESTEKEEASPNNEMSNAEKTTSSSGLNATTTNNQLEKKIENTENPLKITDQKVPRKETKGSVDSGKSAKSFQRVDRWGVIMLGDEDDKFEETKPPTKEEFEWELKWANTLAKWDKYATHYENVKKIRNRIRQGIADPVRGLLWPRLCGADIMQQKAPDLFQKLLSRQLSQKDEEQLQKDLHRTDPRNIIFYNKGLGQESLYHVLKAYCLYNPKVGYCQGMGSLAGLLLMYVPEEMAFWMMVRLLDDPKYECAGLYEPGFPVLFKQLAIHDRILEKFDRKLYRFLQRHNVMSVTYALRWYQGRFYEFPKELFIRIFDIFLAEGKKIIFRVAMYMLMSRRKEFFKRDDDDKANSFARDIRDNPYTKDAPDATTLIKKALKVKVKQRKLEKYEREYESKVNKGNR